MRRLLNKWLGATAILCGMWATAQPTQYAFEKLKPFDTISDAHFQKAMGAPDVRSKFLISKWNDESGKSRLALFKQIGKDWIVFSLFEQQVTENVKLTEDEQYMTYVTSSTVSGEGFSKTRFYFCIVDIEGEKQMPIFQQSNDETWRVTQNQKADPVKQTGCSAQIIWLGKGNLTSVYTATEDFIAADANVDCLPKGQYKVEHDRLVKIK